MSGTPGPETGAAEAVESAAACRPLGPFDVLLMSIWCGLAAGLLEVGARVLTRFSSVSDQLYNLSRHFVWLVPVTNLLLFAGIGAILAAATWRAPRLAGWLAPRVLCALTPLPMLIVGGPHIYAEAWFALCLGIAAVWAPRFERDPAGLRKPLGLSICGMLGLVLVLAGVTFGRDWLKQHRETGRPWPATGAPNVLLIVLDTVRADHLSAYGYERATTPTLDRLAKEAIRFDSVRATAPWTLASHASIFTGRWPHELGVKWVDALGAPTFLRWRNISATTATPPRVLSPIRFIVRTTRDLDRGFTHYEDFDLERFGPFRMAELVDIAVRMRAALVERLASMREAAPFGLLQKWALARLRVAEKKHAGVVNQEFLSWLQERPEPGRPFFAFLNYFDAHSRYVLPPGAEYRFGQKPRTDADFQFLERWDEVDKAKLPQHYRSLITDCYDNCLAYLDLRLGELFEELRRPGRARSHVLDCDGRPWRRTGRARPVRPWRKPLPHRGAACRSCSCLPGSSRFQAVVRETVSLRDLPATITDLVGLGAGSPFPGQSLARSVAGCFWSRRRVDRGGTIRARANNPANPNQGRLAGGAMARSFRWPRAIWSTSATNVDGQRGVIRRARRSARADQSSDMPR